MVGEVTITYASQPDANPEADIDLLAAVYAFVLESHARRRRNVEEGRIAVQKQMITDVKDTSRRARNA